MPDPPPCIFCDIVTGGGAAFVRRDQDVVAFLDVRPLFAGHTLVVPRQHIETLTDLDPEAVAPLFGVVRAVARAVEIAMDAEGSFVAVNNRVSQSVPHLHVHVVPRTKGDGLRGFFWPRQRYADDAEMEVVAARIAGALDSD